jgi:hypothetical protein
VKLFPRNSNGLAGFERFHPARNFLVLGFFDRLILDVETVEQSICQGSALINRERERALQKDRKLLGSLLDFTSRVGSHENILRAWTAFCRPLGREAVFVESLSSVGRRGERSCFEKANPKSTQIKNSP